MKKSGVNGEYKALFNKIESLYAVGVRVGLIKPCDLSILKNRISGLQTDDDIRKFKESGGFNELIEWTRLCGGVCCELVVKPGSPLQHYACSSCPIHKREESFVD